jgi:hypothetical protein
VDFARNRDYGILFYFVLGSVVTVGPVELKQGARGRCRVNLHGFQLEAIRESFGAGSGDVV